MYLSSDHPHSPFNGRPDWRSALGEDPGFIWRTFESGITVASASRGPEEQQASFSPRQRAVPRNFSADVGTLRIAAREPFLLCPCRPATAVSCPSSPPLAFGPLMFISGQLMPRKWVTGPSELFFSSSLLA